MNRQQLGTTMIELMISMTLGMAIIAGICEIFLQSQKSSKIQTATSHMMEDGSYITELFSKELRRAGFMRNPKAYNGATVNILAVDLNTLGSPVAALVNFAQGEAIHGAVTDTFAYRYQLNDVADNPGVGSSPCTRNIGLATTDNPATTVQVVTVFFYQRGNSINCRAKRELVTPGTGVSGTASAPTAVSCLKPVGACSTTSGISIIDNVERILVKYGVDSDCDGTANYYTTADRVDALTTEAGFLTNATMVANCAAKPLVVTSAWQLVVAAKIYVVLQSESNNLTKAAGKFSIDGVSCSGTTGIMACPPTCESLSGSTGVGGCSSGNVPQRRLYRVFSTTVAFRN